MCVLFFFQIDCKSLRVRNCSFNFESHQTVRDNLGCFCLFVCLSLTGGRQGIATLFRKPAESWQTSVKESPSRGDYTFDEWPKLVNIYYSLKKSNNSLNEFALLQDMQQIGNDLSAISRDLALPIHSPISHPHSPPQPNSSSTQQNKFPSAIHTFFSLNEIEVTQTVILGISPTLILSTSQTVNHVNPFSQRRVLENTISPI